MSKRLIFLLLALVLCFTLIACDGDKKESLDPSTPSESTNDSSQSLDTIPPAFIGADNGKYSTIEHLKGEEVDLLKDVTARDNLTKDEDIKISVIDDGKYDKDKVGTYTITIEAKDEAGNTATATRQVIVTEEKASEPIVLKIGGDDAPYLLDEKDALSYTSAGTKFRTTDIIQVMSKDFFVEEYNTHSENHTNNGLVPFFPNGVLIILDEEMAIKQLRLAAGTPMEVDANGNVRTDGFVWTNAIDAENGGGMFKGLITELDGIIPDGGYILVVGNTQPELCRTFLISNLFASEYTGGAVTAAEQDIDITAITIELD